MRIDLYTKLMLTVVAASFAILAANTFFNWQTSDALAVEDTGSLAWHASNGKISSALIASAPNVSRELP